MLMPPHQIAFLRFHILQLLLRVFLDVLFCVCHFLKPLTQDIMFITILCLRLGAE